ncbi:hypothetical protein [Gordonia sp. C13]|uniref:hypothetical protein n=1 Tax=Gordonia sp. C13 TaxID=2935078 RepID=UPI00200A136B|nr:hypothetical protein [Gordonia sp. C13]MCK8616115.1 hypothetical protein [Gordonia sp. C13]
MNGDLCEDARSVLVDFYDTYGKSTVVYIAVPDSDARSLDSYYSLEGVEVRDSIELRADLGYGWGFSIQPSAVTLSDDLYSLTIEGSDLHLWATAMHRVYRWGWIRFSVARDTALTRKLRNFDGAALARFYGEERRKGRRARLLSLCEDDAR